MPRKKVQEPQEQVDLELPEDSPGTDLPQEGNPDSPAQEEAGPPAEGGEDTLDEVSQLLADLDSGDPAAGPPDAESGLSPEEDNGEAAPKEEAPKRSRRRSAAPKTLPSAPMEGVLTERRPRTPARGRPDGVLTIDAKDSIVSAEDEDETIWHEIRNAYRVRRPLTGKLGGVEETADKKTIAVLVSSFRRSFADCAGWTDCIPVSPAQECLCLHSGGQARGLSVDR